jgi:hypothetical protein
MSEMQQQENKPDPVHFCLFQWWEVQEHCKLFLRNLCGPELFYLRQIELTNGSNDNE